MANSKISALNSATSAQAAQKHVIVSGSTNKQITHQTLFAGVPFYVEGTCRATATVAVLPSNSTIFDIYVKVLAQSSAAVGGTTIEVGIGTDNQRYVAAQPVSATGLYRVAPAYTAGPPTVYQGASGAVVAAAPTASANASFLIGIGYFR